MYVRRAGSFDRLSTLQQQAVQAPPKAPIQRAKFPTQVFSLARPEAGLGLRETGGNWCWEGIEEGRTNAAELKEARHVLTPSSCARALIAMSDDVGCQVLR